MDPLRVLHLIDHMGTGGAQEVVCELVQHLRPLGVECDVATLFSSPHDPYRSRLEKCGAQLHDLSSGGAYRPTGALDPRLVVRLRRLLRSSHPDVVHLHLYVAPLHFAAATLGTRRPKAINTLHALKPTLPRFVYPSFRLTRRVTDAFVAPDTDETYRDLEDVGIDAHQRRCLPYAVTPVAKSTDADTISSVRSDLGIAPHAVVLLSAARLHPQRCIDRFIEAMPNLRARDGGRDVQLVLAGDGEQEAELRALAIANGVSEFVHFLGRRDDLPDLYAASDLYVSMAIRGVVGVGAIQAMSAGLPCVAWDVSGRTRTYGDLSDSGACPIASDMETFVSELDLIIRDAVARNDVACHGAAFVRRNHSLDAMLDGYRSLYHELVAGSR